MKLKSGVNEWTMWNSIVNHCSTSTTLNGGGGAAAPSTRCKHAVCLDGVNHRVYLLGGRNGNIPLKDFWTFSLGKLLLRCSWQPRPPFSRSPVAMGFYLVLPSDPSLNNWIVCKWAFITELCLFTYVLLWEAFETVLLYIIVQPWLN